MHASCVSWLKLVHLLDAVEELVDYGAEPMAEEPDPASAQAALQPAVADRYALAAEMIIRHHDQGSPVALSGLALHT